MEDTSLEFDAQTGSSMQIEQTWQPLKGQSVNSSTLHYTKMIGCESILTSPHFLTPLSTPEL